MCGYYCLLLYVLLFSDAAPYKVSLQWSKLDLPYGCPSMERVAVFLGFPKVGVP